MKDEDIKNAARALDLGRYASLSEIKDKYRELSKKWHPDNCEENVDECNKKMSVITKAYETLYKYISNFSYPLFIEEKNVENEDPKEFWKRRFGDDSLWSNNAK